MDKVDKVIITDINMKFLSMITFMVKGAIAAIPAVIILAVISSFVSGLLLNIATR